jgi:hypothetical protein
MKMNKLLERAEHDPFIAEALKDCMKAEDLEYEKGRQMKWTWRKNQSELSIKVRIVQKLTDIMYREGISYRQLAKRSGIGYTMIFKILRIEGTGSIGVLLILLDCCGYKMDFELNKKEA